MKHGLLLTTLLFSACMRQQNAEADTPQQAAARIDVALMREYSLSQEQQKKYNRSPLPGLPPVADDAAVRVLGKCGGYDSDIQAGMRWAAGLSVPGVPPNPNPARVINLSLGGSGACNASSPSRPKTV